MWLSKNGHSELELHLRQLDRFPVVNRSWIFLLEREGDEGMMTRWMMKSKEDEEMGREMEKRDGEERWRREMEKMNK